MNDPEQQGAPSTSFWRWLAGKIKLAWTCVLRFALVLWVARVPLVFTLFGLVLLGFTPQAQDLFVEYDNPDLVTEALQQLWFVAVLTLVWAMPTHYAARLLLDTDSRLRSLLDGEDPALTVNRFSRWSERWLPRLLGLATYAIVEFAIYRSYHNLPDLGAEQKSGVTDPVHHSLIAMALLVAVAAALFGLYVVRRPRNADVAGLRALKRVNRRFAGFWRRIAPGLADPRGSDDELNRDLGRLILLLVFAAFVLIFVLGAGVPGRLFPRAMAVPFILGGWLPFLSYLAGAGRQARAPLITGFALVLMALAWAIGDNHAVRLVNAKAASGRDVDTSTISLDSAARMWMRANHCDAPDAACPRPIIVAAAGGASRAGFFTASIVGYFLQRAADSREIDPADVRNRLFAISGVSGGSVGAVMLTAALDASPDGRTHPCNETPQPLWWGIVVTNWRDCFEAIASGDFLSADFYGFAFNDMLPFRLWRDRAAVLEDSWSARYAQVLRPDGAAGAGRSCTGLDCPFLGLRPRDERWIPLLVLNGTSQTTGGRIVTTALAATYAPRGGCPTAAHDGASCPLFVEATRFHDLLAPSRSARPGEAPGFAARRLLGVIKPDGNDIRLSTAAHNSARFPLISPPGTIRRRDGAIADRIVDGGYFENYGALSAREIALALHAVDRRLAPLVVEISNDPDDEVPKDDASTAADEPQAARPQAGDRVFLSEVLVPLGTVANTRSAHGILGVDELRTAVDDANGCRPGLINIRVWPQPGSDGRSKAVSMSWWLSRPIQRHLHQQTEGRKNRNWNAEHLDAVWKELTAPTCTASQP